MQGPDRLPRTELCKGEKREREIWLAELDESATGSSIIFTPRRIASKERGGKDAGNPKAA